MKNGELLFLPLGGAAEIGMNLNLYGYGDAWLMVDCGVAFGDDTTPGIDLMVPDPGFIAERADKLAAIVITHAHEDHLGALAYLWPRLRAPVYATPFAAAVLRRKLEEAGLLGEVPLREVPLGGGITAGPFKVDFIVAAHSIPEANILAITTPAGTVVHATDWKLDPHPMIGRMTDEAALKRIGDRGVLAMVCDSTNVFVPGEAGSEGAVRDSLVDLVGKYSGRVVVTCFASNVARVESAALAARRNHRHAALVGRSLRQITQAARDTGYLAETDPFLTEDEAGFLPRERTLLIATGSQGEARSALARIALGEHPHTVLEAGDVVIFSSRVIPGNEKSIGRVQDGLARLGVIVVTERDAFVHVSGHPARDELERMYRLVRPRIAVPIHGEARHLRAHGRMARELGVEQPAVVENGAMLRLAPGPAEVIDHAPSGRLALDGKRLIPFGAEVMRTRQRLQFSGIAVATVVIDGNGVMLAPPRLSVPGLIDVETDRSIQDEAIEAIAKAVENLSGAARRDDAAVSEVVRIAVRRRLRERLGKRPMTEVQVVRI